MEQIKKYKSIMVPIILGIFLIWEFWYYNSVSSKYEGVAANIGNALEELKFYIKDPSKAPGDKQLSEIIDYKNNLETLLKQYNYTYKRMANTELSLKLLEFKEKLTELDEKYSKFKIPIPKGIGFKEYQGFTVPQTGEMKYLSRQLHFIIQMIDLLIENNVDAITDIKRVSIENISSTLTKKEMFKAYFINFSFKIGFKNFLNFWDTILTYPSMIMVKDLKIKSNFVPGENTLEGQLITVEMQLCLVEYDE
ncbi:MAG: hypothetical protein ACD_79C01390G0002 [uncultured bacterium]|nr:MAG: hypothetical protein ACD_79C01390G0002 [uncultured bacterium]